MSAWSSTTGAATGGSTASAAAMLLPCTFQGSGGFAERPERGPRAGSETLRPADRTWGMISRSTLIGALVVVELGIVGFATEAIAGGSVYRPPTLFDRAPFGLPEPGAPVAPGAPGLIGARSEGSGRLHRSFAAGPVPHVVIDVRDIELVVEGDNGTAVRVDEDLRKSGWVSGEFAALSAQQALDSVRIAADRPEGTHFVIGCYQRRVRVTVPNTARVEITGAGHIEVNGLRSRLVAHTPDGAIR